MANFLVAHIRDTENPQTYVQHWRVAFINSCKLGWACVLGIVHSICPWWFPFTTSTQIIKSFKILLDTKRHKSELRAILSHGYLLDEHLSEE